MHLIGVSHWLDLPSLNGEEGVWSFRVYHTDCIMRDWSGRSSVRERDFEYGHNTYVYLTFDYRLQLFTTA